MEFFADSPRFVRKRFHASQTQVTHLQHSETCACLKCQLFARTAPKLGIQIPHDVLDGLANTQISMVDTASEKKHAERTKTQKAATSTGSGSVSKKQVSATGADPVRVSIHVIYVGIVWFVNQSAALEVATQCHSMDSYDFAAEAGL